jgi:DNA-binding transcriptional ArsR family regulator
VGEYGPKITPSDVAVKIGISKRSVGRIRSAYAQNSSIDDVFRFTKLSDQTSCQTTERVNDSEESTKRKARYVEMEDLGSEPILLENVKCRVTLSKEEREQLNAIINSGKQSARKFNRAKILLLADEGIHGPSMTDKEIAEKLDISIPTVRRVRKLLITEGQIESVLNFNHHKAGRMPKIDGKIEATIIAQACSAPPEGYCKWTVRLLADRLVELEVIDSISHTAVAQALKKTNLNLGNVRSG